MGKVVRTISTILEAITSFGYCLIVLSIITTFLFLFAITNYVIYDIKVRKLEKQNEINNKDGHVICMFSDKPCIKETVHMGISDCDKCEENKNKKKE